MTQLYGIFDPYTHEWSDGVLVSILQNFFFVSSLMPKQNKLECLSLVNFQGQSNIYKEARNITITVNTARVGSKPYSQALDNSENF